ncbi:hypothetical protein GCM10025875_17250 [Litorihabitans aurantiacus]|uniref:Uncharacterized protein n=1 Tax=Litorihabitans aurantiacus TaxID=1930061 RepID=A0AA38CP69_9MICO|nr:DUF3040 domain-containing protein [Litorihabitans aurantiacus]GMA31733.1 hypothetical protein GCM10025875_17250 [Litorihabitans aurantiacus]
MVLGALVVVAGLGLLVGGVSQQMTWLGVLGFLAMFGGVLVAMSRGRSTQEQGGGAAPAPRPTTAASRSSFMTRLDERWDRRRENGR